jgi:hypothetical protein
MAATAGNLRFGDAAMRLIKRRAGLTIVISVCVTGIAAAAQADQVKLFQVTVDWSRSSGPLKTIPTLQVVVNPLLRRGSTIHDAAFTAVKDLGADYVRFVPWNPYPKLAVAELEPPRDGKTFWDFSLIDPLTLDFLDATKGHSPILNFSTEPVWMFKNDNPVTYPVDPDEVNWSYSFSPDKGLIDPTAQQLADYYARLVSWYSRGGFTDEYGHYHQSGYHYDVPYWEVLNEPEDEHKPTPYQYTLWYDAIVAAIRKVSPRTKFVGLALANLDAQRFEYFLNPRNHRPGTPLDMISYHFYATPGPTESINQWQYSFFSQADQFLTSVGFIELIRKRLSPSTRTTIDEVGSILPNDGDHATPAAIPTGYWNLSAATFAYVFMKLSPVGIDVIGESQLVGYPTQFPDVTMIDWTNGKPNARYWMLRMLKERLTLGDEICATEVSPIQDPTDVAAQGYRSTRGERKILLINERDHVVQLDVGPQAAGGRLEVVDEATGESPARASTLDAHVITLAPFAVAIVTLH